MIRSMIPVLALTAVASGVPLHAQESGGKGIFGLLSKMTKPGATGEAYTTLSGRTYQTVNFHHVSADQGKTYQAAMDQKNGFRAYRFGMTADEFAQAAKEAGESFKKSLNPILTGPETATLEPVGGQVMAQVGVQILYGFYRGKFCSVLVKPTDSMTSKAKAAQIYQAVAETFGPGLTLRDPKATVGGYAGVLWYSDRMEVQMAGGFDPSAHAARAQNPNLAPQDATAGECPVLLRFDSKDGLKEYYEAKAKKAAAGI